MITGLPAYKPPVVESVRCYCGKFYHVFVGGEEYQAQFAEKVAQEIDARFVDAQCEPFVTCTYGQVLDFAPEISMLLM